jgi:hypothetical protein
MKPLQIGIIAIWLILHATIGQAQEKYSKVKVQVPSPEAKKELVRLLHLDHFGMEGNTIICEIETAALTLLQQTQFKYEVLVDDVAQHLQAVNKQYDAARKRQTDALGTQESMLFDASCKTAATLIKKPAAFTTAGAMGGYYNYAEMDAAMTALANAHPTLVTKFSIGKSVENRDLWAIKISDNVATDEAEPEVLYSGLQHAREAITGTSLIFFMQYLLENYGTDARVTNLVNNREIFLVPCVNPDGYEQNRASSPTGGGMWRKNKNMSRGDGVDLNRNYNVDWGRAGGGSNTPGDDTYWGTSAFSEPETQAMRAFITARNFIIAIDQHCYGPYYSLPFGFQTPHTLSAADQNFYSYIPALMGKYNCHRAGNSVQTVGYEVAGGIKDYFVLGDIGVGTKSKVYGMTGEAGGGGFWAPKAEIVSLCQGLCFQNLQLATAAGSYVDLQDVSDIDVTTRTGNFPFLLRRVGLANNLVTVTLLPIENILLAGTAVTTSLANYYDTYNGNISYTLPVTITNGQRVRFAWKIETGNMTWYDTVTKFYNPNLLLNDDMEGTLTTNWVVPNGGQASTKWAFTNTAAYAGSFSMTESPSGNYAASDERIVTYKNSFDFSNATAAYLSFWVKQRAENCNDKLQVQVSGDGGTTYTPVCGLNTITENDGALGGQPALTGIRENWTREVMDLSAFKSKNNVKLRFVFTSNTDASTDDFYRKVDDGFYIDNVKVIKTSSALTVLPATFLTFSGKLLPDQQVKLYWEAYEDNARSYFEVQRSKDGITFTSIGQGPLFPPFHFLDPSPQLGNNFYRIKEVKKDGTGTYSKVVQIQVQKEFGIALYPNPVHDKLSIQVSGRDVEQGQIRITDIQGREVYRSAKTNVAGAAMLHIDTRRWPAQTYILKAFNQKSEVLLTKKIIKL